MPLIKQTPINNLPKMYTKAQLKQMNKSPNYGHDWIKNIEAIGDKELAEIYPTWDAGLRCGRIYVALPSTLLITQVERLKWNLM